MLTYSILAAPLMAAAASGAVLAALLRAPALVLDKPNERSLHERPTPRTGGIAIISAALASAALWFPEARSLCALAAVIALVSLIDDWKDLAVLPRLSAHFVVAVFYVRYGLGTVSVLETILLVFGIVWLANLYNFMDGSDGLAAGMAVIGFGAYALCAWMSGNAVLGALSATIAAAAAPFLVINFHPARMFMGDVGSVTLGFLAAAVGLLGWREGAWPSLVPLLVFSPFIVDATVTLARRALTGRTVWHAHREHYYQKLVRMGLGHRNTALLEYAAMVLAAAVGMALPALEPPIQLAVAGTWLALLLAAGWVIDIRWARHQQREMRA